MRVWILENPSLASTFSPEGSNNISSPGMNLTVNSSAGLGVSGGEYTDNGQRTIDSHDNIDFILVILE